MRSSSGHDLRSIPFFSDLSDDVLDAISRRLLREHYHKGATVFSQDEPGACIYLIESGHVQVISHKDGRDDILAFLGPGNFFGETALLLGEKPSASVQVVLDANLLVLRKTDFDELLLQHPVMAITITRELSRRLGKTCHTPALRKQIGIIAVVGAAAPALARHVAAVTGDVFLFDLGGLGNTPLDQATYACNHVFLVRGGDTLNAEMLPGRLSNLVEQYYWVLLSVRPEDLPLTLKAVELAEAIVILGTASKKWVAHTPQSAFYADENEPSLKRAARRIAQRQVGLAMSSGNASGMAHIGVVKVLERERIPIDIIAGTSAGAVSGALYAAGQSIEEITDFAFHVQRHFNFRSGLRFWDLRVPPLSGLLKGNVILGHFRDSLEDKSFDDLRIPLYIVAADLISGEEIVFEKQSVAEAVRASMSVIGILEPAQVNGRFLIDGGTVNPVPSQLLANKGMNAIIASNVIPSLEDRLHRQELKRVGRLPNAVSILTGAMEIMESEIIRTRMGPVDILIQPDVTRYGTLEYAKALEIIRCGEEAAWQQIPRIRQLLAPQPRPPLQG